MVTGNRRVLRRISWLRCAGCGLLFLSVLLPVGGISTSGIALWLVPLDVNASRLPLQANTRGSRPAWPAGQHPYRSLGEPRSFNLAHGESHMGPNARHLSELIRRYQLDDRSPQVAQIRRWIEWGRLPENIARSYLYAIQPLIEAQESRPNYLARAPTVEELYPDGVGDLVIGELVEAEGVPVALSLTGALNSIFAGVTGSGKTTGIRDLIVAVHEWNQRHPDRRVAIVCLDFKGGDYADLPGLLGGECVHLSIQDQTRIALNAPYGVPPRVWINECSAFVAARAGLVASSICLANMMDFLVTAMNPVPREPLIWPTFRMLLDLANRAPLTLFASKPDYEKTLIQRLEGIVRATGDLFNAFRGLDLEERIISQGKNVVIDMCGFSPAWVRGIVIDLLVSQLLVGRQFRYQRGDAIDCLFVMDEADQDVSRLAERCFPDGILPISRCMKQGRESRIGVCLGLSALGPASRMILANATHHFFFAMGDAESLNDARNTLLLQPGAEVIIPSLERGECLYRGPGPWSQATLAKLKNLPPSRVKRPNRFDAHPFVPAKRLDDMPEVLDTLARLIAEHGRTRQRQRRQEHAELRPEARALLCQASLHPYWPVARLYDEMGRPAAATQKAIRKELLDGGYANIEDVRVGSKPLALIELKDMAWQLLGKPPVPLRGRGSLAHRTFANWIAMVGERRGHDSVCEWILPETDHAVDTAWKVSEEWQVFEVVVTCTDNLEGHLVSVFLTPGSLVETTTIVAPQKSMLDAIRAQIAACHRLAPVHDRIMFVRLRLQTAGLTQLPIARAAAARDVAPAPPSPAALNQPVCERQL